MTVLWLKQTTAWGTAMGPRQALKTVHFVLQVHLRVVSPALQRALSTSSPPIVPLWTQRKALQRKHSYPTRQSAPAPNRSETPKRRSQSMKSAHIRSKTVFGRSGSTKRAIERTLRQSQTLSEELNPPLEPRRLSSEEVFQQVDSRIPSEPPSYQQAVQDNSHVALSSCKPLTVQNARCLSKQSCVHSRSSSEETLDLSSGNEHFDFHNTDSTDTCCDSMSGSSSELRQRTTSESGYEAPIQVWGNQEDLRETYVWFIVHVYYCCYFLLEAKWLFIWPHNEALTFQDFKYNSECSICWILFFILVQFVCDSLFLCPWDFYSLAPQKQTFYWKALWGNFTTPILSFCAMFAELMYMLKIYANHMYVFFWNKDMK